MLSGTTLVAASTGSTVVGAEPTLVDDSYRSLARGVRQPRVPNPGTMADGLLTDLGDRTFAILRHTAPDIVLVDEDEIRWAARFHLERMKLVVEPSGATPLAALREIAARWAGRRVGLIISGGNTDFSRLAG